MFLSRISLPAPPTPEAEDIFSSALPALFTDDAPNSHGTPGSSVTYHSPRFGDLALRIPAYPGFEEGRKLFAHHLWNAGVIAADAIETASQDHDERDRLDTQDPTHVLVQWNKKYWDVRGKRVLELGAGTALPSLICALAGAASVTITDHPSSPALTSGAIEQNVRDNVLKRRRKRTTSITNVDVFGYTWGTSKMYLTSHYGKPAPSQPDSFDRIIIADCLWMPMQHVNLVKTILRYLESSPTAPAPSSSPSSQQHQPDDQACVFVVAGFHTGRGIVRHFFKVQGRLRAAEIFEIDVSGIRRPWLPVREGETKEQSKRWCVCAVLVRR
ncbi:hypothetical protein A1O1_08485 [Capronia coronata CBS 617.96]|uniref:Nicotinamide N-methyltransferase n=1 Tax=Capronia coronata CBS 617.96 TaxID=1182541 RepID=W9XTP9_9EURO|nr:uncharacterized protein A1O1_08485 [Capronia coronata CBS 617.96]EXJ80341.1 hypothetical protein A1O1_08485 [Capronia coronata CBS 617.96]